MKSFENNIVFFGFGAVGQSALTILEKEIDFDKSKLVIIDKEPKPFDLEYKYVQAELQSGKQEEFFSPYLSKGDLLLDFSSDTDCIENIKWCYEKEVMYLNTGDNEWPDAEWKTIYKHYLSNERFFETCNKDAATIIVHHGANPGSVSHFVKKGLFDIAQELISGETDLDKSKLKKLLFDEKWAELAEYLEVRTIHSSDRDIQVLNPDKVEKDVFYSTWNPTTFYNESISNAEVRIGTTEKLNKEKLNIKTYDEQVGGVELISRGTECYSKSWVPVGGEFYGMIVGHEELYSISNCLSTYNLDGTVKYRPTVYFCYLASDIAMESLKEVAAQNYTEPSEYKLIKGDVIHGTEYVGVLIMGNKFKSRWVGNCITLERIKKSYPGQMSTILQVSIPAIAAVSYMIDNRNIGINYPDDLPYNKILNIVERYADETISVMTDFTVSHDISKDFVTRDIAKMDFTQKIIDKAS